MGLLCGRVKKKWPKTENVCTFSNRLMCPVLSRATLQRVKWAKVPIVTQAGVAVLKRFLVDDHVAVHRTKPFTHFSKFSMADKRATPPMVKQTLRRWWSHTHTHIFYDSPKLECANLHYYCGRLVSDAILDGEHTCTQAISLPKWVCVAFFRPQARHVNFGANSALVADG